MMNSFFARTTLLGLSLIAATASAKPFTGTDAIQGDFVARSSARYANAQVTLDHGKDTLALTLQPLCPKGEICESEPEAAEYVFESVNSTVNRCGVVTSVALIDQTPVDGIRTEVTLTDNSKSTCGASKPAAVMNVKQKWYNRLAGRWVQINDRFIAKKLDVEIPFQGVIDANLESVTSQAFIGGHVLLDGRKTFVELTVQPVMPPCPEGRACIQRMPEPVTYTFENAETEIDQCGIIRTVASFDDTPVDGVAIKVTINNNRNNICPTLVALNALDVVVEQAYYSRFDEKRIETVDLLKADDFAMIKPGK